MTTSTIARPRKATGAKETASGDEQFLSYIHGALCNEDIDKLEIILPAYIRSGLIDKALEPKLRQALEFRKQEVVLEAIWRLYPFIESDKLNTIVQAELAVRIAKLELIDWVPTNPDSPILAQIHEHRLTLFKELPSCRDLGPRGKMLIRAANKIYREGHPFGARQITRKCKTCGHSVLAREILCDNRFHLEYSRFIDYYRKKVRRGAASEDEQRLFDLLLRKSNVIFCTSCRLSLINTRQPEWCKNIEHGVASRAAHVERQMKIHSRRQQEKRVSSGRG